MDSQSVVLVKNHCQTILANMSELEEPDIAQSVDKLTFLKVLSSLSAALQIVINHLNETESNERQTDNQLAISIEDKNSGSGDELINPFEFSHDEHEIDFNGHQGGFNRSSSENTNMNDVVQEMHDSVNAMKDSSLGNIDTIDDDLDSDMIEIISYDGTMNDVINIQAVEAGTASTDLLEAEEAEEEEEVTEPTRKRKLRINLDTDSGFGQVHSKQSRRVIEHTNVTSAINDEDSQSSDTFESISSTQFGVENNGEYEYEDEEYPVGNVVQTISTEMAERLRLQIEKFIRFGEYKIKGICYFCEEDEKVMQRSTWERHILMHTGERPFACEGCSKSFAKETDHDNRMCSNTPINIFLTNSSDCSLIGYCCKECNYLQIERKRMTAHLMNEHGFECPTENVHYEKLTLVPAIQQYNAESASADLSSDSTQDTTNSNPSMHETSEFTPNEGVENELIRHTVQTSDGENRIQGYLNTDSNIYCKSQTKCVLCDTTSTLALHYKRSHFESEYHFARPSPEMADRLRSQVEQFTVNENGKIKGRCYFCKDINTFSRLNWRLHFLIHTGEGGYSCEHCSMEVKHKNQHKIIPIHNNLYKNGCNGNLIDICEANSTDGSYVVYMCQDCNYVQFKHGRIVKHLKIEHGYHSSDIRSHYGKFTLIPNTHN